MGIPGHAAAHGQQGVPRRDGRLRRDGLGHGSRGGRRRPHLGRPGDTPCAHDVPGRRRLGHRHPGRAAAPEPGPGAGGAWCSSGTGAFPSTRWPRPPSSSRPRRRCGNGSWPCGRWPGSARLPSAAPSWAGRPRVAGARWSLVVGGVACLLCGITALPVLRRVDRRAEQQRSDERDLMNRASQAGQSPTIGAWSQRYSTPHDGVPSTGSPSPTSPITGPLTPAVPRCLQPARGPQRLPAAHGRRADRGPRSRAMSGDVGCVLITGNGPSPRDGGWAFCSGGDQRIRGRDGYRYAEGETAEMIDPARAGRLHIMEVHRLIRFMPKVVIAVVPGWAAGGGHSLHVVCDLTIASVQRRVQADRRRRGQLRRGLRLGLPGPSGRPEVRAGDLLPGERRTRPRTGWARSTRWCRTPTWSRPRWSGPGRSTGRARPRSGC